MPFVSFCFSTYKRPDILIETVKTVLQQSFTDFEVIISDNDPEESGKKIKEVITDSRVKYFPNKVNLGMKKSFNKSLERSSGEYIVMIADDDPVYPDMLQTLVDLQQKNPGYGMYMGACNWFCTNVKMADLYHLKVGMNSFLVHQDIDTVRYFTASEFLLGFFRFEVLPNYLWSNCFVKREILIEKGGIPDYGTAFLGDYAYLCVAASHSGCVVINRALGHQTIHTSNHGTAQNDQIKTLCKNFIPYIKERIKGLPEYDEIVARMEKFVGGWTAAQMATLYKYFKGTLPQLPEDFKLAEKEVFALPGIKQYYTKYYITSRYPRLNAWLVNIKKRLRF